MTILRLARPFRSHVSAIIFNLPKLTLILGGAASGKSRFAEDLISRQTDLRTYIATARAFDAEMQEKILQHQRDRGGDWHTIEAPTDLPGALGALGPDRAVLVDCLTLWLSNLMLEKNLDHDPSEPFLTAARACPAPIVTVSNEVGHGIVPDTRLGRRFRNEQGRLNQKVAAAADLVVLVTAGLPQVLKGRLP